MSLICRIEGCPVRIDGQVEQRPVCHLNAGHEGPHAAVVLDSDDNAITERWN